MEPVEIGIIGGSGLYALASQSDMVEVEVDTPWGSPSGHYRVGTVAGRRVAFLARHGVGHRLAPSEVNFRANVWGFKQLGVSCLLSASAVGSLKEELSPRHFVLVDQFIDRTSGRQTTFFGDGLVAHVSLADPTCARLRELASAAGETLKAKVHARGTYVCIDGPQFSTRAESHLYRSWGADVIGMTNATEARLAREAELCYASVAMVTDFDCWKEDEEAVSVEALLEVLHDNAHLATSLLGRMIETMPATRSCGCGQALATALVTDPKAIPGATRERLSLLVGRYLSGRR
jgi:5'-methylthioadenosine phosphorylase